MRFMGTPENIIDMSVHYARILFISMPVLFLYFSIQRLYEVQEILRHRFIS